MSWFILTLICISGWGLADIFYKKSAAGDDRYSHLKTSVWVGMIMGVCAAFLIPFTESDFSLSGFFVSALKYSPASLSYIISMVIGYAGLRYLEISVASPVQNASGALSAICIAVWFAFSGRAYDITEELSVFDISGTVLIVAGVIALAVLESRESRKNTEYTGKEKKKYSKGALALLFPLLYCVFDTVGTAADGIILDEDAGMGLGEIDVIVLYGITFFLFGAGCFVYLLLKTKKVYNPFAAKERPKLFAAVFEEFGQIFYVYAMAANPVLGAPMIASYCIVSVILSRIMIKEKLTLSRYLCVFTVIAGIVLLGISEGLSGM